MVVRGKMRARYNLKPMLSRTKPNLNPGEISRVVTEFAGEPPVKVTELTDGWFGAAFAVEFAEQDDLVMKVSPEGEGCLLRYEANLMAAEVGASQLVRAKADLPIPEIVRYDTTREHLPYDYFLVKRLRGVPYNHVKETMSLDAKEAVDRQIARHLVELHSKVKSAKFGLFNGPFFDSYVDAAANWLDDLRADFADFGVDGVAEGMQAATELLPALSGLKQAHLIHWDLWDGNIFVIPETGEVTGYIDFERARWGDPLMEQNFMEPNPVIAEEYGGALNEENARTRICFAKLYLHLIMVAECVPRGFASDHEAWARRLLAESITEAQMLNGGL